jgi:hypothetical protein
MSSPSTPRLARILDAGTVALGVLAMSIGVGLFDVRLGVAVFGGLLLAAQLAAAILSR